VELIINFRGGKMSKQIEMELEEDRGQEETSFERKLRLFRVEGQTEYNFQKFCDKLKSEEENDSE
jgi:hypothetical protein